MSEVSYIKDAYGDSQRLSEPYGSSMGDSETSMRELPKIQMELSFKLQVKQGLVAYSGIPMVHGLQDFQDPTLVGELMNCSWIVELEYSLLEANVCF
ncbi:hypothetical protein VNO78_08168 [Psophocarpus tetragonolobus]|uniref:Uncharacterized protein n=1 Tax=Psophocarpus tetragonolobus TaxID=3891 RepID=A0AAN9SUM7_PSOTE